ncbi:MAG: tetratricopeptide repeat protein, partial [Bacteroidota bacterium]
VQDFNKASESPDYEQQCPILVCDIYYQQERYQRLIDYIQPIIRRNNQLHQLKEIYLLTADAYFYQEDFTNSLSYYKQYLGLITEPPQAEVLYRLGFSQYKSGDYQGASTSLKALADENSEQGQYAAYYLGISYIRLKNFRFATTALEQAESLKFDVKIEEEANWLLAKLYFDESRFDEAIEHLKRFLKNYPNSQNRDQALDLISRSYLSSQKYEEALEYIESLARRSSRLNTAYQQIAFAQGSQYFNNGRYTQAILFFQKSLNNPQLPELVLRSKFWQAEAYSLSGNFEAAIPNYQEILNVYAANSALSLQSHYGLGYAYYNTEDYARAIPHFQYYVGQGPGILNGGEEYYPDARVRLADCFYAEKRYDDALSIYESVIQKQAEEVDYAYLQKGIILDNLNRSDEALAALGFLIEQYPQSLYFDEAIFERASINLSAQAYAVAIDGLSTLIREKPNSPLIPNALSKRGLAFQNLSNQNAAVEDYKKIVNEYPSHPRASDALFRLQELLAQLGRTNELSPLIQKFNDANPNNRTSEKLFFENAKNAYFNQQYQQAISLFQQYLSQYAQGVNLEEAHYYLGESYYRLDDYDKALPYYDLILAPQKGVFYSRAARRAAGISFAQKNYAQSIQYNKVLANSTESSRELLLAWSGLMKNYFEIGQYDSLLTYADQIIQQGKSARSRNEAFLFKGKVALAQQNYPSARQIFLDLSENANDEYGAEASYLIADIYYRQQRYQESLDQLFSLNKKFSNFEKWRGRAFLLIADNYIALGETFQAKATLQSLIDKSPDPFVVSEARTKLSKLP